MKTTHLIIASLLVSLTSLAAFAEQTAPKPISQPQPLYAFELRKACLEGAVEVAYTVDPQGNVTHLKILSSTNRVFEQPTLEAMRRWKYTPAMENGTPISFVSKLLVMYSGDWNNSATKTEALVAQLRKRNG